MSKILVVDDEESICMLYEQELSEEGYDVRVANDGKQCLQALEEELSSTKVASNEKDNEFDRLKNLLRAKEDEFNNNIAQKKAEITEIQSNLTAREKELEIIKNRGFWQRLKACFQNQ